MYLSLQQHSPPGTAQVGAGLEPGLGWELRRRKSCSAKQSFSVVHWDFSMDHLPEPLISGTLLLHDSAERVILAACCGWKIVLPALGCVFER